MAGDVDAVSVIGDNLHEARNVLPGGHSRMEHNGAGQVMPQPIVAPQVSPPPAPPTPAFSFSPNQIAGSPWYRPGDPDRANNGHLDESFGHRDQWPKLLQNLKTHHGAFGIPAAEIGVMNHSANPAWCRTPDDFHRIVFTSPQYNSVRYLELLVDVLDAAGFKPRTVFMHVDWTYRLPYATEVLRRHKSSLAARGVQMGINVMDAGLGEQEELVSDGHTLSRRPAGTGAEVDEATPGSLAHAANRIVDPP